MSTSQPRIMALPPMGAMNGSGLALQKWIAARSADEDQRAEADQRRGQARRPVTAGEQRQHQHRRCLGERDQRQRPEDMRIAEMGAAGRRGDADGTQDAGDGDGGAGEPGGFGGHGKLRIVTMGIGGALRWAVAGGKAPHGRMRFSACG